MLTIKTVLLPFRMSLSNKQPVSLRAEITNNSDITKLISVKFLVSKYLSVEKTGLANSLERKLGEIEANKTKIYYFDIFPKTQTVPHDFPARIIFTEHTEDYNYIEKEYKKEFTIKVDN